MPSPLSNFVRNATKDDKIRVYTKAIDKSIERQVGIMNDKMYRAEGEEGCVFESIGEAVFMCLEHGRPFTTADVPKAMTIDVFEPDRLNADQVAVEIEDRINDLLYDKTDGIDCDQQLLDMEKFGNDIKALASLCVGADTGVYRPVRTTEVDVCGYVDIDEYIDDGE